MAQGDRTSRIICGHFPSVMLAVASLWPWSERPHLASPGGLGSRQGGLIRVTSDLVAQSSPGGHPASPSFLQRSRGTVPQVTSPDPREGLRPPPLDGRLIAVQLTGRCRPSGPRLENTTGSPLTGSSPPIPPQPPASCRDSPSRASAGPPSLPHPQGAGRERPRARSPAHTPALLTAAGLTRQGAG